MLQYLDPPASWCTGVHSVHLWHLSVLLHTAELIVGFVEIWYHKSHERALPTLDSHEIVSHEIVSHEPASHELASHELASHEQAFHGLASIC